jgi:hypothetical protein
MRSLMIGRTGIESSTTCDIGNNTNHTEKKIEQRRHKTGTLEQGMMQELLTEGIRLVGSRGLP